MNVFSKALSSQFFRNFSSRSCSSNVRQIAIVGAGQAGLFLGIALKKLGHTVSIFSNRTPEEIACGSIMSNQGMFNSALSLEREIGIDFWQQQCPQNNTVTFSLAKPDKNEVGIHWAGRVAQPYQSVDQRIKFPRWIEEFKRLGGQFIIEDVGLSELNKIVKWNELTIISAGKGEISQLFTTNRFNTIYKQPQRALSCLYVKGVKPAETSGVRGNILPGIGEFFAMPGLTLSGNCEMMLFEGIPNGPLDSWKAIKNVEQQFETALTFLKKYVPWEAERFMSAEPTDNKAGLIGGYTPIVRKPILHLPCGKSAIGIADVVVLNDPSAGQGANNACKAAALFVDRITRHGNNIFDNSWMNETHQMYWDQHGKWATVWSNMLLAPPPNHFVELLMAATRHQKLADILANGFNDPSTLFPWIVDPNETKRMIEAFDTMNSNDLDNNTLSPQIRI